MKPFHRVSMPTPGCDVAADQLAATIGLAVDVHERAQPREKALRAGTSSRRRRSRLAIPDLRHEPAVGAEAVADVAVVGERVEVRRVVAPLQIAGVPVSVCPVHSSARSGRFGVRVSLTSHCPVTTSVAGRSPLEVGPDDAVVAVAPPIDPGASRLCLAIGHEHADERQPDVALGARDEHRRAEILGARIRSVRARAESTLPPPSSSATSTV